MTDLPTKSHLTSGDTTEAQFQSAIGDLYDVVAQLAVLGPPESLVMASGTIVPTKGLVTVDTEGESSSDNLSLITPTSIGQKVLFLRSTSAARVVNLLHNQSGTGKLWLNGGVTASLVDPSYVIVLLWNSTTSRWEELWRSWGLYTTTTAERDAIKTALGLAGTFAPLNNANLTGTPTAPTATAGTNTTQLATTAFTTAAVAALNAALGSSIPAQINAAIQTPNRNSQGVKTISVNTPSGGSHGDVWYRV